MPLFHLSTNTNFVQSLYKYKQFYIKESEVKFPNSLLICGTIYLFTYKPQNILQGRGKPFCQWEC